MSLKKLVEETNKLLKEAVIEQVLEMLSDFKEDGISILPVGDNVDEFYNSGEDKTATPVVHNYMVQGRISSDRYNELISALESMNVMFRNSSHKRNDGQVEVNLDLPNH